jgi:hypothetical protein
MDKVTPACIADHIHPHDGSYNAFLLGELQSLCKPCHDKHKRRVDMHGFSDAVDVDGWPIDPNHPSNVRDRTGNSMEPAKKEPVTSKVWNSTC